MTSPLQQDNLRIVDEIRANFIVIQNTIDILKEELERPDVLTSYNFIGQNISKATTMEQIHKHR